MINGLRVLNLLLAPISCELRTYVLEKNNKKDKNTNEFGLCEEMTSNGFSQC